MLKPPAISLDHPFHDPLASWDYLPEASSASNEEATQDVGPELADDVRNLVVVAQLQAYEAGQPGVHRPDSLPPLTQNVR
jgi:hypothetical protein